MEQAGASASASRGAFVSQLLALQPQIEARAAELKTCAAEAANLEQRNSERAAELEAQQRATREELAQQEHLEQRQKDVRTSFECFRRTSGQAEQTLASCKATGNEVAAAAAARVGLADKVCLKVQMLTKIANTEAQLLEKAEQRVADAVAAEGREMATVFAGLLEALPAGRAACTAHAAECAEGYSTLRAKWVTARMRADELLLRGRVAEGTLKHSTARHAALASSADEAAREKAASAAAQEELAAEVAAAKAAAEDARAEAQRLWFEARAAQRSADEVRMAGEAEVRALQTRAAATAAAAAEFPLAAADAAERETREAAAAEADAVVAVLRELGAARKVHLAVGTHVAPLRAELQEAEHQLEIVRTDAAAQENEKTQSSDADTLAALVAEAREEGTARTGIERTEAYDRQTIVQDALRARLAATPPRSMSQRRRPTSGARSGKDAAGSPAPKPWRLNGGGAAAAAAGSRRPGSGSRDAPRKRMLSVDEERGLSETPRPAKMSRKTRPGSGSAFTGLLGSVSDARGAAEPDSLSDISSLFRETGDAGSASARPGASASRRRGMLSGL